MKQETLNTPCSRMLFAILAIGAILIVMLAPKPAFADDAEDAQLQAQIVSTADDYNTATAKVADLKQQMEDNQARIDEISNELPEQQQRSSDAVKTLYVVQQEGYGLLQMVLGSENINDFLARLEYIDRIQQHNVGQLQKLTDMKSELEATQQSLDQDAKQADLEADRAQRALAQAQQAREEAQQRAEAEAAAQAANTASVQVDTSAQGQDSQNTESSAAVDSGASDGSSSGNIDGSINSGGVNWSSDKAAFVAEWGARINNYLAGSPMAGEGEVFASAAWDNGVDPRWSPAIAYVESSLGAYCFRPHNAWGWGSSSWGSWDEAINAHVAGLASGYGSTLTYAAAAKYCPPNADFWYNKCLAQMNSI